MTTNSYFQGGNGPGRNTEQNLVENMVIELIQMSGHDCYYIPRSLFAQDKFFKEVPNDKFEDYYKIEMFPNNATDFAGQGDLMSKFGLMVEDTFEFVCARKRFLQESGIENPSEGDLIYFPLTKHLFEIDFVEDEPGLIGQFYPLSKLYTFMFKCSLFDYSYEEFDTGIVDIDDKFDADTFVPEEFDDYHEIINDEARDRALNFDESNPFGTTIEED